MLIKEENPFLYRSCKGRGQCILKESLLRDYASMLSGSSVRTTSTSQWAERMIRSDTLPRKMRSAAFKPVAPQIIKSILYFLTKSTGINFLGEPYSITTWTFSAPAEAAVCL